MLLAWILPVTQQGGYVANAGFSPAQYRENPGSVDWTMVSVGIRYQRQDVR
jgi:hypothetical protein